MGTRNTLFIWKSCTKMEWKRLHTIYLCPKSHRGLCMSLVGEIWQFQVIYLLVDKIATQNSGSGTCSKRCVLNNKTETYITWDRHFLLNSMEIFWNVLRGCDIFRKIMLAEEKLNNLLPLLLFFLNSKNKLNSIISVKSYDIIFQHWGQKMGRDGGLSLPTPPILPPIIRIYNKK